MANAPFSASYLKLARARQFISELEVEQEKYKNSDPASGTVGITGEINLQWKAIGDWPGAIVGDSIHNLRTALDLMACELARLNSQSDKKVYFPFCDNEAALPGIIECRNFDRCGQAAVDLLKRFAPYRGRNIGLRGIHDLDIQDKHTTIIVMGSKMGVRSQGSVSLTNPGDIQASFTLVDFAYMFGGEDMPFVDEPVVKTLKDLVQLVDGVLKAFAAIPRG